LGLRGYLHAGVRGPGAGRGDEDVVRGLFRVPVFRFQVSGFGSFQVLGFRFRVLGSGFRVSGLGFRISGRVTYRNGHGHEARGWDGVVGCEGQRRRRRPPFRLLESLWLRVQGWGLGLGAWGVGCWVLGVGCGVWGVGCGVWGVGRGVWGVGCGVEGLVLGVWCLVFGVLGCGVYVGKHARGECEMEVVARLGEAGEEERHSLPRGNLHQHLARQGMVVSVWGSGVRVHMSS
jgi:hypothetical protein